MKRTLHWLIIAAALLALSSACAPSKTQLAHGVWAAERDLWNEAAFRWKRVLEENPASAAAWNNLAVAYEKQGRWDEAEKAYQAALKIAPDNASIKANYEKFTAGAIKPKEKPEAKNEKK